MLTRFRFLNLKSGGAVARIVLNRPPLNVLDLDMIGELNQALQAIGSESELRALVLSAEGKVFSAGVAVEDHLPDRVDVMIKAFHAAFRRLNALSCPMIAAVQGAALGGGCELACFADWVVAGDTSTFGLPEIKLGSFPPVAAVHFPHRIGRARTLQLILSGETMGAAEAERIGLVDRVVPTQGLDIAVEQIVQRLLEKSSPILRLAKRATSLSDDQDFESALTEVERLFLGTLMKTSDAVEGLRAFLEKRPPRWAHR